MLLTIPSHLGVDFDLHIREYFAELVALGWVGRITEPFQLTAFRSEWGAVAPRTRMVGSSAHV